MSIIRTQGNSIFSDQVRELVAIGASIAANCEPCLKYHVIEAGKLGVAVEDMRMAVNMALAVKESPAKSIRSLADKFLGEQESTDCGCGCTSGSKPSGGKCC